MVMSLEGDRGVSNGDTI